MNNLVEKWAVIIGFENYVISSFGRVRNLKTGKLTKPRIAESSATRSGHVSIRLSKNNVRTEVGIHILVTRHFLGEKPPLTDIRFRDNNHLNPRIDNLEYRCCLDDHRILIKRYVPESNTVTKVTTGEPQLKRTRIRRAEDRRMNTYVDPSIFEESHDPEPVSLRSNRWEG